MSSDLEDLDTLKNQLLSNKSISSNAKNFSQIKINELQILNTAKPEELINRPNSDNYSIRNSNNDSTESDSQPVSKHLNTTKILSIHNRTGYDSGNTRDNDSDSETESEDLDTLKNQLIPNKINSKINNNISQTGIKIKQGEPSINTIDSFSSEINRSHRNNKNVETNSNSNQPHSGNNNNASDSDSKKRKSSPINAPGYNQKLSKCLNQNRFDGQDEFEVYNNISDSETNKHEDKNSQDKEYDADDNDEIGDKWWLKDPNDIKYKWKTLEHNGPMFPPKYIPHGVKIKYKKHLVALPPPVEEIATLWAKILHKRQAKDEKVQKNFFIDFKAAIDQHMPKCIIKHFSKCDFTPIRDYLNNLSLEDSEKYYHRQRRMIKLDQYRKWAFCKFDGQEEPVLNCFIAPPKILLDSNFTSLIGRVQTPPSPEDITINIGKGVTPPSAPENHRWGDIIHNRQRVWIARWADKLTNRSILVFPNKSSTQRTQHLFKKLENARSFNRIRKDFRQNYMSKIKSPDMVQRQIATIFYFLERFTIRPGHFDYQMKNSIGGTISLTSEKLDLEAPNHVTFRIRHAWADGVEFSMDVDEQVFKNLQLFLSLVEKGKHIFKGLRAVSINKEIKKYSSHLSIFSIIISNINITLQKYLEKTPSNLKLTDKLEYLKNTILSVIKQCNLHHDNYLNEMETYLENGYAIRVYKYKRRRIRRSIIHRFPTILKSQPQLEEDESDLEDDWCREYIQMKANEDRTNVKEAFEIEGVLPKDKHKEFSNIEEVLEYIDMEENSLLEELQCDEYQMPDTLKSLKSQLDALDRQFSSESLGAITDNTQKEALRSYTRWFDARILVAWAKRHEVPLASFITKIAIFNYTWAKDTPSDFKF